MWATPFQRGCPPTALERALTQAAQDALVHRFQLAGELSPRVCAAIVARTLPRAWRRRLLWGLRQSRWLCHGARVPFDALEDARCPAALRGPLCGVAQLAIFGLPGQGLASRDRHRGDTYQRLCAEIMRTAVDTASLNAVAGRALSHPDVCADSELAASLRAFIAEREAALRTARTTPGEEFQAQSETSKLTQGFSSRGRDEPPTRMEVLEAFGRHHRELDALLAQYDERRAIKVLDRLRDLRRRFPAHVTAADLQQCEEQHDDTARRRAAYQRQLQELTQQAAEAAAQGDLDRAGWVLRRLDAVHALLPELLTSGMYTELRDLVLRSSTDHEVAEALRELRLRQREVVSQIKHLAGVVHQFHRLAEERPPTDNAYRRAEVNYQHALQQIRQMNTEWLTGLVLELETFLQDLGEDGGQMHTQLDRFIGQVRTALNRLCLEIRAWQRDHPPPAA